MSESALVPFRVSGPAAEQTGGTRLFQIGGYPIFLVQRPHDSGALRPLASRSPGASWDVDVETTFDRCDGQQQGAGAQQQRQGGDALPQLQQQGAGSQQQEQRQQKQGAGTQPQRLQGAGTQQQGTGTVQEQQPQEPCACQPASGGKAHLANVGLVAWQCGFVLADYLLRQPPFETWHGVHVVELGSGVGTVGIALALAGASVLLTDLPHVLPLTQVCACVSCWHACNVCVREGGYAYACVHA